MLRIEKEHADEMVAHSIEEDPNECCGILTGSVDAVSKVNRITNTARSPFRYLMDPQAQLNVMLEADRSGQEITAFYHSHTHSPAYPSPTDVRMAQQSGWLGDDVFYRLVSLENKDDPTIRAFHLQEDGEIVEEELEISP